jgi:hypothetical protein
MKKLLTMTASLALVAIVAPSSHAQTNVQGGPYTNLAPNTTSKIHLALSGFPTTHGLYIVEAVQPAAGARPTVISPAQLWVSSVAADLAQGATPINGDVILTVDNGNAWGADCVHQQCGIFIRLDHTASSDTSEDQFIPLTFNGAAVATSASTAPVDVLTVLIDGKPVQANSPSTIKYRTPLSFKVTTASGVAATLKSYTPDLCPITGNKVDALKGSGQCDVAVSSAGDATHSAITSHFPFLVTPADQTVGIKKFIDKKGKSISLESVTRFGEKITYASTSPNCVIKANTVKLNAVGTCSISATAPGSANYTALNSTITITIRK